MNERPILFSTPMVQAILAGRKTQTRRICKHQSWSFSELHDVNSNGITQKADKSVSCPYGQVGDFLWVRETHSFYLDAIMYRADEPSVFKNIKWKPSIFMRKIYSRIWLKITDIRVERVKCITEEEAICEGFEKYGPFKDYNPSKHPDCVSLRSRERLKPAQAFQNIWININGKESWNKNPWVWVIKFEVISTTGKPESL